MCEAVFLQEHFADSRTCRLVFLQEHIRREGPRSTHRSAASPPAIQFRPKSSHYSVEVFLQEHSCPLGFDGEGKAWQRQVTLRSALGARGRFPDEAGHVAGMFL